MMKEIFLFLLIITILKANDENLKLSGYLESKMSYFASEDEITTANALFRLEGNYEVTDKGKVETHLLYYYDMQPVDPFSGFKENSFYSKLIDQYFQESYENLDGTDQIIVARLLEIYSSSTFDHLAYSAFYPKEKLVMDRALIKLYFDSFDLNFGKQQIAWGTGYAFNPTDIWNIKDATNPNGSKVGVLAINLEYFFGENSSLNIITAPGSNFDHWRYGFRVKSTVDRYEYSFSAIRDKSDDGAMLNIPEKIQLGTDFAGEIINRIGIFGEIAVSNPRYTGMEMSETDSLYFQLSTGLDYTFKNGLYLLGEYYYNDLGKSDYKDYDFLSFTRLTAGEMSGLAKNYFSAAASYSFFDDYTFTLISLTNLNDISSVLVPEIEYAFHQNILIKFNSNIYIGNSSVTEFGGLINKYTVSVIGYF
ncbi:MAG: hypothetical protein L6407_02860 [Candidatus Delongbacteria bacterium]|nr:hypothetical protein [Candidatus Delongbacteria bacterium]